MSKAKTQENDQGDSGAHILSGQEQAYIKRNPPSDIRAYMGRYCAAKKNQPLGRLRNLIDLSDTGH
jgi:hypothetical protein